VLASAEDLERVIALKTEGKSVREIAGEYRPKVKVRPLIAILV
jgi:hypothetical protein